MSDPRMKKVTMNFNEIQSMMQVFETKMAPRFQGVDNRHLTKSGLTAEERDFLTGQTTQALHLRFVNLQARVQTDWQDSNYERELNQYATELKAHIDYGIGVFDKYKVKAVIGPAQNMQ